MKLRRTVAGSYGACTVSVRFVKGEDGGWGGDDMEWDLWSLGGWVVRWL